MPIKFACPSCERKLAVKDEMAGKKGKCPGCGSLLSIPRASQPAPAVSRPTEAAPVPAPGRETARNGDPAPPALPPENVEEEAAAALADEPSSGPEESQTIGFDCPMCGEAVEVDAELAGKRMPCPECRRIIKVPELEKKAPVKWARRAEEPPPEGAWGTGAQATRVSIESLEEADALPVEKEPVTWGTRVRRGVWILGGTAALLLLWTQVSGWRSARKQQRTLQDALAVADRMRKGPLPAALHRAAGEYYLTSKQEGAAEAAVEQLDKALSLLAQPAGAEAAGDRELALLDLGLTWVELGGTDEEARDGLAMSWDNVHRRLRATLGAIRSSEARQEALWRVGRRLIARKQAQRLLPLAAQLFPDAQQRLKVQALVGVELFAAEEKDEAGKVASLVLAPYRGKEPPPVHARAVVLAVLTGQKPPEAPKGSLEKESEVAGRAEALARQGKLVEARKLLALATYPQYQFRVLLPIAAAQAAGGLDRSDVEAAVKVASQLRGRSDVSSWQLLRLVELTIKAGLPEAQQQQVAGLITDRALLGRAQLEILQGKLASASGVVEPAALDAITPGQGSGIRSLSHALAAQALARHNVQHSSGWKATIESWEESLQAFGAMGIALGLREEG